MVLLFATLSAAPAQAQVRFGFKGGLSTYDLGNTGVLDIISCSNNFQLSIQDASYGYHLGLVLQARFSSFVMQLESVFNSNGVNFSLQDLTNNTPALILSERYQNLDIPLLLGLKAGPMRLMAGAVGHYFINSPSDLLDFESYEQRFSDLTYGWQGGIGIDVLNVMFDIRYEGNLSRFGDHIVFAGNSYSFDSRPARLIASLAVTIK